MFNNSRKDKTTQFLPSPHSVSWDIYTRNSKSKLMSAVVLWDTSETERRQEMSALTDCRFLSQEGMTHAELSPSTVRPVSSNLTSLHQATDSEETASRDWSMRERESMTTSQELVIPDGPPMETKQTSTLILISITKIDLLSCITASSLTISS